MSQSEAKKNKYEAVVIGVSAGGMAALKELLSAISDKFPVPIVIVQHLAEESNGYLPEFLDNSCALTVKEADEKEAILPGHVYIAPAGYHLLIEEDKTFSLTAEQRINYSRPSVNVLFDSAAEVYEQRLIGIILTGANSDGATGLQHIKESGGYAIVQNPLTAESSSMPYAACHATTVDQCIDLPEIAPLLNSMLIIEGGGNNG